MKVRLLKRLLKANGWSYKREGKGDHTIWEKDGITIPIDGKGGHEIPIGTLKALLKQTGITLETKTKKGND